MSKQYRRLITVADAAGYVLAAPDDDVAPIAEKSHVEATFRNGHIQAAKKAAIKAATTRPLPPVSPSRALVPAKAPVTAASWLNAAIAYIRPKGGLAA